MVYCVIISLCVCMPLLQCCFAIAFMLFYAVFAVFCVCSGGEEKRRKTEKEEDEEFMAQQVHFVLFYTVLNAIYSILNEIHTFMMLF